MKIGDRFEILSEVTEDNTALKLKSGTLKVYSTIAMLNLIEEAAYKCINDELPEGKASVGILMNVEHISASPIGSSIKVIVEISDILNDGRMIDFNVEAYDCVTLIGKGTHRRAIISTEKFLDKCYKKLENI